MAFLNDSVFDSGLAYATTNGTKIDICTTEPATYAGIAAVTLGNDTVVAGAPAAGSPTGRGVTVPAITAGTVTGTNTASFWALSDGASILVATGSITTPQAVTSGNTFTLDAIALTITDATSV